MKISNKGKILGILIVMVATITGCSVYNHVKKDDVQKYLENKYGEEEEFYFVEKGYCNLFEVGTCSYYYSSSRLESDEKFLVEWTDGYGKNIYDDYINKKYQPQIEEYYDDLLSSVLDFDYKITVTSVYYDFEPTITFNNYLKAKDLNASIIIKTKEQNLNIEKLSSDIIDIINKNEINNIKNLSIEQYNTSNIYQESHYIINN